MATIGPISSSKVQAILTARDIIQKKPVYLDTETTGLDNNSEIIEIAIIDEDGSILFQSLIKPVQPIPQSVTRIHGISNSMVKEAKPWAILWQTIRGSLFSRMIGIYNVDFDIRMIQQSHNLYGLRMEKFNTFDIMKIYAQYQGNWDSRYQTYRFYKQEEAARLCRIPVTNLHRAAEDAALSRKILHFIAETKITE